MEITLGPLGSMIVGNLGVIYPRILMLRSTGHPSAKKSQLIERSPCPPRISPARPPNASPARLPRRRRSNLHYDRHSPVTRTV